MKLNEQVLKKVHIALHENSASELRGDTCHMMILHGRHQPYGITQFYLSPNTDERAPP